MSIGNRCDLHFPARIFTLDQNFLWPQRLYLCIDFARKLFCKLLLFLLYFSLSLSLSFFICLLKFLPQCRFDFADSVAGGLTQRLADSLACRLESGGNLLRKSLPAAFLM